jgi:hypothetical protein
MTRIAEPQLSFADLELRNQGVHLDPLLQGILAFLDDRAPLVEQVRHGLLWGRAALGRGTRWLESKAERSLRVRTGLDLMLRPLTYSIGLILFLAFDSQDTQFIYSQF